MSAQPVSAIHQPSIGELVRRAWADHVESDRRSPPAEPREYCYASARRDCVRAMALDLLYPWEQREVSTDALARMQRGEEREQAAIARLLQIGPRCIPPFKVVEQQRAFDIRDRDGVLLIRGKVDARLQFAHGPVVPVECKSGESYRNCETVEDLDRGVWTKHAVDQLLVYLLGSGEEVGLFIIDRPGLPNFIEVRLLEHLARAESFMRDARAAIDARRGNAALPPHIANAGECRRCPHLGRGCSPALSFGPGVRVIDDEHLAELAECRERNRAARDEYEHADRELKRELRGTEHGILGPYEVRGRWQRKTWLELPDDLKAQYTRTDPQGSFRLEIERVVS